MKSKIACPVNGWQFPYYQNGICTIDDPMYECDDYYAIMGGLWND